MDKKIFICGKTYELTAQNHAATAKKIQRRVDRMCSDPDTGKRLVTFSMQVTPVPESDEHDIDFIFGRNNFCAIVGSNPESINDSDAMLIMGMDGRFQPPMKWQSAQYFAPMRYHVKLLDFMYAYAGTATALKATSVIGMQVDSTKTELRLKIRV